MGRFCFKLAICTALAGSLAAADKVTSVVRADLRTGKLVRSVVVTPKPAAARAITPKVVAPVEVGAQPASAPASARPDISQGINAVVESVAAQYSLRPQLIHSVIKVESNYNPRAISPKGALGLMQLVPQTARRFGVSDVFDPVENIQGGAAYLKYLLDLYNNDLKLALAAYNAGEGAVAKYGDVPPYAETRNYLVQVKRHLEEANKAEEAVARQKQQEIRAQRPDGPRQIEPVANADGTVTYVVRP